MTEKQFLMWLPRAQAWLKRHYRYGLELQIIGLPGSGSKRQMIQTPEFTTRFDPLTAVALIVGPQKFYDVSNWNQAALDLGLSEEFSGRLLSTIYQKADDRYDHILRGELLRAIS